MITRGEMKRTRRASSFFKDCSFALFSLCAFFCLSACSDIEDNIYRGHRCYFVYDTTLHLTNHLTMAIGNTGHFLIVRDSMGSGIRHILTIRNFDQARDTTKLTTEKEKLATCLLGANHAIIVGRSTYTGLLMAYEGQCSNCLSNYGGTNYPLTWSSNGQQLNCARCKRSYDVNNGVVTAGEGGHQLYLYNAAFENGLIRAWN